MYELPHSVRQYDTSKTNLTSTYSVGKGKIKEYIVNKCI